MKNAMYGKVAAKKAPAKKKMAVPAKKKASAMKKMMK
jgi:hypothetical protein